MPWRTHCLTDSLERAWADSALAAQAHFLDGDRDLVVGHRRELGGKAGDVLARQVELDGVDAVLEEHADALAHLLGAAHHGAEAELGVRQVGSVSSPRPPGTVISWLAAR